MASFQKDFLTTVETAVMLLVWMYGKFPVHSLNVRNSVSAVAEFK